MAELFPFKNKTGDAYNLLQYFYGFRIFRIVLGSTGFIAEAVLFEAIADALSGGGPVALVAGIVGGIIGFYGYRIFRIVLESTGFIAKAVLYGDIADALSGGGPIELVAGIAGGIIGALLIFWVH